MACVYCHHENRAHREGAICTAGNPACLCTRYMNSDERHARAEDGMRIVADWHKAVYALTEAARDVPTLAVEVQAVDAAAERMEQHRRGASALH